MEAQLYNHYPLGDGCSIVIGLSEHDIAYLTEAADKLALNDSQPYSSPMTKVLELLNNIIIETRKDDTQGIRLMDERLKKLQQT